MIIISILFLLSVLTIAPRFRLFPITTICSGALIAYCASAVILKEFLPFLWLLALSSFVLSIPRMRYSGSYLLKLVLILMIVFLFSSWEKVILILIVAIFPNSCRFRYSLPVVVAIISVCGIFYLKFNATIIEMAVIALIILDYWAIMPRRSRYF